MARKPTSRERTAPKQSAASGKKPRRSAASASRPRKAKTLKRPSRTARRRGPAASRAPTKRQRALPSSLPPFTRLTLGARGAEVRRLQRRLVEVGFSPGAIDGHFGFGTEAAVRAFQLSAGLLCDGVAGPRTLVALELSRDDRLPSALPRLTVQVIATMCPAAPLDNIKTYLPPLIRALEDDGLVDQTMLLMAVATICAETGRFAPLDEYRSRYNTSPSARAPYFDLYDNRADLGNRGPRDGSDFKGRGFVQLTGRANYERYSKALGLGDRLLREPGLANDPMIAARVLVRFLKDRELKIKRALLEGNFAQARKYVNGGTHGIVDFTRSYLAGEPLLA